MFWKFTLGHFYCKFCSKIFSDILTTAENRLELIPVSPFKSSLFCLENQIFYSLNVAHIPFQSKRPISATPNKFHTPVFCLHKQFVCFLVNTAQTYTYKIYIRLICHINAIFDMYNNLNSNVRFVFDIVLYIDIIISSTLNEIASGHYCHRRRFTYIGSFTFHFKMAIREMMI